MTSDIKIETNLGPDEMLLFEILDIAHEAIVSVDEDQNILLFNKSAERTFGFERNEVLGRPLALLLPEAVQPTHLHYINQFASSSDASRLMIERNEISGRRKNGEIFLAEASISKTRVAGKRVFTAFLQDISERKRVDEQLRQSQKMQTLGTLAGGVAHDFNNILTPILGYSELLMENTKGAGEDHAYASTIFHSAQRAKDLVTQILLFSRRGHSEKEVADLCPLVREVVEFAGSALPKTILVREEISTESAPVFCDTSQIHQVLVNLSVNAGQAISDYGEIKIALDALELEEYKCFAGKLLSGRYIRIAVTDTGEGIEEETLEHIFEPFFTTKAVGKGTGLGLSTVYGIVESHGGGIVVSSERGKGTTFEIFLSSSEETPVKRPDTLDRNKETGTENILLADDEEAITSLAKKSLERLGYTVTVVSDGQEALQTFAADPERFELVITDQTMPNMTGDILARELIKLKPDIRIILCTGHSTVISPETSKAMGVGRFLYKPFGPMELARAVREVLDQATDRD